MRFLFLFITIYLPQILFAQFDMASYLSQNVQLNQEDFLNQYYQN